MDKETKNFLLKYSKIGVLASMKKLDEIESDELKEEYIRIKKELSESENTQTQTKKNTTKPGEEKESAVKTWFKGIGERQRKYQEKNKGKIM